MRFAKAMLWLVAVSVAAFFAGAWLLPDRVGIERSIVIGRSPQAVHAVLDGFSRFNEWSPWAGSDPLARYDFQGPAAGVGATMRWQGNRAIGSGELRIIESVPDQRVVAVLDLGDGQCSTITFLLQPVADGTRLTWRFDADFSGDRLGRWFGPFLGHMVGRDYEQGLARLKQLLESEPEPAAAVAPVVAGEPIDFEPLALFSIGGSAPIDDPRAVAAALAAMYQRISDEIQRLGVSQAGPPLTVTHGIEDGVWRFDAAIPVDRGDVAPAGDVRADVSPSGRSLRFVHIGPYDGMHLYWRSAMRWLDEHGYRQRGPAIEQYVSDPGETPPDRLVTHLVVPIE